MHLSLHVPIYMYHSAGERWGPLTTGVSLCGGDFDNTLSTVHYTTWTIMCTLYMYTLTHNLPCPQALFPVFVHETRLQKTGDEAI